MKSPSKNHIQPAYAQNRLIIQEFNRDRVRITKKSVYSINTIDFLVSREIYSIFMITIRHTLSVLESWLFQ